MKLYKMSASSEKSHQNKVELYFFDEEAAELKAEWYRSLPECLTASVKPIKTEDEPK